MSGDAGGMQVVRIIGVFGLDNPAEASGKGQKDHYRVSHGAQFRATSQPAQDVPLDPQASISPPVPPHILRKPMAAHDFRTQANLRRRWFLVRGSHPREFWLGQACSCLK